MVDKLVLRVGLLFARSLTGGSESDSAWDAVGELHRLGSRFVFERAAAWCNSPLAIKRERGVQTLCQLRRYSRVPSSPSRSRKHLSSEAVYVSESFAVVSNVMRNEYDGRVILACLYAFMHLDVAECLPLVLPYATNENAEVRLAVTHVLGAYHMHDAPEAVDALLLLMEDEDREIRNWATFGLGTQSDADSEVLRAAFLRHLTDRYFEVRAEAASALAKRRDMRVIQPLIDLYRRCTYVSISMDYAMRELLEEDFDSRWTADECVVALRTAYPQSIEGAGPKEIPSGAEAPPISRA